MFTVLWTCARPMPLCRTISGRDRLAYKKNFGREIFTNPDDFVHTNPSLSDGVRPDSERFRRHVSSVPRRRITHQRARARSRATGVAQLLAVRRKMEIPAGIRLDGHGRHRVQLNQPITPPPLPDPTYSLPMRAKRHKYFNKESTVRPQ